MYYDLLSKLKNAEMAKKETVYTGFSKMDHAILKVLAKYKFVKEVQKKTSNGKPMLEVKLAGKKNDPAIREFQIRDQGIDVAATFASAKPVLPPYFTMPRRTRTSEPMRLMNGHSNALTFHRFNDLTLQHVKSPFTCLVLCH